MPDARSRLGFPTWFGWLLRAFTFVPVVALTAGSLRVDASGDAGALFRHRTTVRDVVYLAYGLQLAAAVLAYVDARRVGLRHLRRARLRTNSTERSSPIEWALAVRVLSLFHRPYYLAIQPRLAAYVIRSEGLPGFASGAERRAAMRTTRTLAHGAAL